MNTRLNTFVSSAGVINDDLNSNIYILGGRPNSEIIYKIDHLKKSVMELDIKLPFNGISATNTILINDRIYSFRGDNKGTTFMYTSYTNIDIENVPNPAPRDSAI